MRLFNCFVVVLGLAMTPPAVASPLAVTGEWGGSRARLSLEKSGGRIEYDCGAGTLDSPVLPDAKGAFSVLGKHSDFSTRPTAQNTADALSVARYEGVVVGDRMTLTVLIAGETSQRVYSLVRGQYVKLIRCM